MNVSYQILKRISLILFFASLMLLQFILIWIGWITIFEKIEECFSGIYISFFLDRFRKLGPIAGLIYMILPFYKKFYILEKYNKKNE